MKKTLLSLALVLFAGVAGAQTLTKVWETTDVLTMTQARFATGANGNVYAIDAPNKALYAINGDGKVQVTTADQKIGGGWAIIVDDAGNILANQGQYGTSITDWQIFDLENNALKELKLTLPDEISLTGNQVFFCAAASGDVLSTEGGALFFVTNTGTKGVKVVIKGGVVESYAVVAEIPADKTFKYVNENVLVPYGDSFICRDRSNGTIFIKDGAMTYPKTPALTVNNTGFDIISLGGVEYGIIPTGEKVGEGDEATVNGYMKDGFSVYTLADGNVVASRPITQTAQGTYRVALVAEKVSETKANIYFYKPGELAAMYTFEVPNPQTALENVAEQVEVRKVIENGQLVIIRDGVRYNVLGAQIK